MACCSQINGTPFSTSVRRTWRRAFQIYLAAITVLALSFFIYFVAYAAFGAARLMPIELFQTVGPLDYIWHSITLQQSTGYSMVLRLYVFLMLVAPLYLWLAQQRFWYPLLPAAAIWFVSGHMGFASRDSLTGELLSMTLFPWQMIFASGIALGAALTSNIPLPRSRALSLVAFMVVVAGTLLLVAGPYLSSGLHTWIETRNDFFWTGISKSYQSPLRLLYLYSLVYLFLAFPTAPVIRLLHNSASDSLINRLGRNSLEVFAVGAVLAVAIDQILWIGIARDLIKPAALSAIGLEVLLFIFGVMIMKRVADYGDHGSVSMFANWFDKVGPASPRNTPR